MTTTGRDRLRELLDAVLDDDNARLTDMADDAYASKYHFSRLFARDTGEPPVALRRRVMLERAAWQLGRGQSVTDAAFAAGYDSVEGFSRAFNRAYGVAPSRLGGGQHWLPAPNGIHFHPPTSLWVHTTEQPMSPLTDQLINHDLDDTRSLLELAKQLSEEDYRRVRLPGQVVLFWDGPDESVAAVLEHQVWTKEVWLAAIEGRDLPDRGSDEVGALIERHEAVSPGWLSMVRDIDRRDAWDDTLIDALCDPPESFQLASVIAHVVTFAAARRQLARSMLRAAGLEVDHGDPIDWLRQRSDTHGGEE